MKLVFYIFISLILVFIFGKEIGSYLVSGSTEKIITIQFFGIVCSGIYFLIEAIKLFRAKFSKVNKYE